MLLREGLVGLLQRFGHEVVAAVGDADGAAGGGARAIRPTWWSPTCGCRPASPTRGCGRRWRCGPTYPSLAVLVLSQYVEPTYAAELLDTGGGRGVGYLLKDRVGEVEEFVDALTRVAAGGTVVDPEVVRQLLGRRRDPLARLTPREREVLALMAEGRSNAAIARALVVTEAAVAKHIASILLKLDLPPDADDHRRVLAVLAYLRG